jgi:hypothetical protein
MKKLNLLLFILTLLFSGKIYSQGMTTPEPIKSPLLESMMGTWVSEPYEMMGSKMTDVVTQSMILNGQFMEIDIKSTADNGFVWEGKGIMAPMKDGTMEGWMYDIFGVDGITTYTGTIDGSKIALTGTSKMGTESREIAMDGNIMIHAVRFNFKGPDGKAMPEQIMTITYNKKN